MPTVKELARAVAQLSPDDLRAFRAWFAEHDALAWDEQFEADVASGALDSLADEALTDLREGRSIDL